MKLHLTFDFSIIPTYLTFRHSKNPVDNLDEFIDDGELTHLVVDYCLSRFPIDKYNSLIDHWIKKLGNGGTLEIWDMDIRILCKLFSKDIVSLIDFNKYIATNESAITIVEIEKLLRAKGFKIVDKCIYNRCAFKIKAEKLGN